MNLDQIIAFEEGTLDLDGVLELFSSGIKSGLVWELQGFYGRTAAQLIEDGYLSKTGEIIFKKVLIH